MKFPSIFIKINKNFHHLDKIYRYHSYIFCPIHKLIILEIILKSEKLERRINMKQFYTIALSLILSFGFSGCKKQEETLPPIEAIQKQLLEMEGYSCTATLTRISNKGENVYETIQNVKTTGEYKLELISPEAVAGNYTLYDGEKICQYNPKLDEAIVKDVPIDQARNELFLNQFIKNYLQSTELQSETIESNEIDESLSIILEASITGTDPAIQFEKLWIDHETLLPIRLVLYDNNHEERYIIDYNEFIYNPEFSENLFQILE